MTDINTLIRLNVELEGLLRVLIDRDSLHARSLLAEKFSQYSDALQQYLAQAHHTPAQTEAIADRGRELAAEAHATEVKDQEAVEPEITDEATAAIPQEQEPISPKEQPISLTAQQPISPKAQQPISPKAQQPVSLTTAFTINDKFRFRRELFNGDIEDFEDTLSLIAQMPSYDEAVDYLTNDLLWDKRNPAVGEFFEILKKNMPS